MKLQTSFFEYFLYGCYFQKLQSDSDSSLNGVLTTIQLLVCGTSTGRLAPLFMNENKHGCLHHLEQPQ